MALNWQLCCRAQTFDTQPFCVEILCRADPHSFLVNVPSTLNYRAFQNTNHSGPKRPLYGIENCNKQMQWFTGCSPVSECVNARQLIYYMIVCLHWVRDTTNRENKVIHMEDMVSKSWDNFPRWTRRIHWRMQVVSYFDSL